MAIIEPERWRRQDIFLDYPFEGVMFRWAHQTHEVYRKFYGGNRSRGYAAVANAACGC